MYDVLKLPNWIALYITRTTRTTELIGFIEKAAPDLVYCTGLVSLLKAN